MDDSIERAAAEGPSSSGKPRREIFVLIAGIGLFVLINIFTAEKSPTVWCDEVMYQDPAVNLYQGHGFTSGAWYAQHLDQFWAGNVPLYQFALFGWLKLFGLSVTTVRSFHAVTVGLAVIAAWAGVRRLSLIRSPAHRLFFCVVILLGSGTTFVYRSARPESLCMLLAALALFAFSLDSRPLRLLMLALIGGLLTWSGLQMVPYAGLLCAIAWLMGPRRLRLETAMICAGCFAGLISLYLFYANHGVWNDFIMSIRRHTIANQGVNYDMIPGYGVGLTHKLKKLPNIYLDYSSLPMLAIAAWLGWRIFRSRATMNEHSPFLFGILAAVFVPLALYIVGVFPIYYYWMAFTPLVLGICAELANRSRPQPGRLLNLGILSLVAIACLLGLPRRLTVAAFEWRARSYEPVMELAAPYVARDKFVFSEYAAYYAARQNSATVILPAHLAMLRDQDKAAISVAILRNSDVDALARDFGGTWREAGALHPKPAKQLLPGLHEQLDSQQYALKVFVREPQLPHR